MCVGKNDNIEFLASPKDSGTDTIAEIHMVLREPDQRFQYIGIERILEDPSTTESYKKSLVERIAKTLHVCM
jgi:hypothetical protein